MELKQTLVEERSARLATEEQSGLLGWPRRRTKKQRCRESQRGPSRLRFWSYDVNWLRAIEPRLVVSCEQLFIGMLVSEFALSHTSRGTTTTVVGDIIVWFAPECASVFPLIFH